MQYLLSEDEYNTLKSIPDKLIEEKNKIIQDLCSKIANEVPIKVDWSDEVAPWGCTLTKDYEWYCDECIVRKLCPSKRKNYSK